MREVILLRHAHASTAAAAQGDHDRALSPIGQQEAVAAGRWLAEHAVSCGGVRLDVVALHLDPATETYRVRHVAGAGL